MRSRVSLIRGCSLNFLCMNFVVEYQDPRYNFELLAHEVRDVNEIGFFLQNFPEKND